MTDNQFGSRDIASLISRSANRTPSLAKIPSYARWQRRPPPRARPPPATPRARPPARQKHTKTRLPFLSSSSSSSSSSFHSQALDLPRDLRSLARSLAPKACKTTSSVRARSRHSYRARARARATSEPNLLNMLLPSNARWQRRPPKTHDKRSYRSFRKMSPRENRSAISDAFVVRMIMH